MIPYGRQNIDQRDVDAVVDILRSEWLTQGPVVARFESAVASYVGAKYGVAVNSATSALHISCLALGVGPGDRVWTSPNTFLASANCALYCGATVDFVDIDERTYNISVAALTAKLEAAEKSGTLPKVVIPVHFAGQSCAMAEIRSLSRRYDFRIVEDASHAIGGRYLNAPIGGCAYSDVAVFSFHPVKIITTGEGGMALTNDSGLAEKMRRLRTHGVTRVPQEMERATEGAWYYEQRDLGFNYRMTDIQAALGLSQLSRIETFIARRREIARRYDEALADLPVRRPFQHPDAVSAFHLYAIQVDTKNGAVDRRTLFENMRNAGIGVNVHYVPVHTQPYYRSMGFRFGQYPQAEKYYADALSLPLYFDLSTLEQATVVGALAKGLRA